MEAKSFGLLFLFGGLLHAATPSNPAEFFELRVRPVLAEKCYGCHTLTKLGGLQLDSREHVLAGGKSGPAIKPGYPDASLLLQAIRQTHTTLKMPPGGKLKDEQIADIAAWVKAGAIWPDGPAKTVAYKITPEQRNFWSFRPVLEPPQPRLRNEKSAPTAIDRFILAKLEQRNLTPAKPADRRTLIRRASLDLTGLPPTPEQVDAFVANKSPNAWAKVIDSLLASPRYGERWGRFWLDIARYSDDKLNPTDDEPHPNAFRYRDWVIGAFNADMPYNQFVKAQIAGDLLPEKEKYEAGLGLYALSPEFQDDRVDATTRGFLGLTVACAQCHNHKYDPIPQTDYYSLLGIFENTQMHEVPLAPKNEVEEFRKQEARLNGKKDEIKKFVDEQSQSLAEMLAGNASTYMLSVAGDDAKTSLDTETKDKWKKYLASPEKEHPFLKAWFDAKTPEQRKQAAKDFEATLLKVNVEKKLVDDKNHIKLGLNPNRNDLSQADLVSLDRDKFRLWEDFFSGRGVLHYGDGKVDRFLAPVWKEHLDALHTEQKDIEKDQQPHYPFLQTISDKENPGKQKLWIRGDRGNPGELTPPRFVSILSPDDPKLFTKGSGRLELAEAIASETNPLTARVMANRIWQHHFGQGLVRTPSNFGEMGDRPANPELLDYLASQFVKTGWSVKQLTRMILLSAAYQQSAESNEKNAAADPENRLIWHYNRQRLDAESLRDGVLFISGKLDPQLGGKPEKMTDANTRRTVYGFVSRRKLDPALALFDFPNPNSTSEQRMATNVPLQRLFFMNNPWILAQSKAIAARLQGDETAAKIDQAYRLFYQRKPTPDEKKAGLEYIRDAGPTSWPFYMQVLLSSNEFEFVD